VWNNSETEESKRFSPLIEFRLGMKYAQLNRPLLGHRSGNLRSSLFLSYDVVRCCQIYYWSCLNADSILRSVRKQCKGHIRYCFRMDSIYF
jgi:hypothetical protein